MAWQVEQEGSASQPPAHQGDLGNTLLRSPGSDSSCPLVLLVLLGGKKLPVAALMEKGSGWGKGEGTALPLPNTRPPLAQNRWTWQDRVFVAPA